MPRSVRNSLKINTLKRKEIGLIVERSSATWPSYAYDGQVVELVSTFDRQNKTHSTIGDKPRDDIAASKSRQTIAQTTPTSSWKYCYQSPITLAYARLEKQMKKDIHQAILE